MEKERIVRINRRPEMKLWMRILIKVSFIIFALLVCGILSSLVKPGSFGKFYEYMMQGTFSSAKTVIKLFWEAGILFLIAVGLTPAFKMKFWNIGAEGQVLMGALGCLIALKFIAPHVPNFLAIIIELIMAVIFGATWSFIPAFFKAKFNTNETLFTLMMNYIAMGIVAACVVAWSTSGSNVLGVINNANHEGWLPLIKQIGSSKIGNSYLINVIIIGGLASVAWAYLKFSQHGYELAVVGGSRNTAKYVGINVQSVIIRTLILSGAIAGVAGFLMVAGSSHTVTATLAGGRGFTAILVAWLGEFNVPLMVVYSFLVAFVSTGSSNAAAWIGYSSTIGNVLTGIFFLLIIVSTFFVNFRVDIKLPFLRKKKKPEEMEESK